MDNWSDSEELLDIPDSQLVSEDELVRLISENGICVDNAIKTGEQKRGDDSREGLSVSSKSGSHGAKTVKVGADSFSAGVLEKISTSISTAGECNGVDSVSSGALPLKEDSNDSSFATSNFSRKTVREINLIKRMKGENYTGFSKKRNATTGKLTNCQDQPRESRKMGDTCASSLCLKRQNRHCSEFLPSERKQIFEDFWKMDWSAKRALVSSLVDQMKPKQRKATSDPDRKTETRVFHLKFNGVRKQVCRQMFLKTLGLGEKQLRNWMSTPQQERTSRKVQVIDYPVSRLRGKGGDPVFAKKFLDDLPKLPSHYCRKDTNKLYLEPIFRTLAQLLKVYKEKCNEINATPVSQRTFYRLVDQKNIAIHQPKKDRCDTCCGKEAGNITDEEYNAHVTKKETARKEKVKDKLLAQENKAHVITMDVQKVLLCPLLNASALYYKTKLIVHNFTVFDLATKNATCFLWNETQADLVASVFATCLLDYFEEYFKDDLPIIIYSDGATSQNRNSTLSNALVHYAVKNRKSIVQKYLEKGHTQMEVDSVHAHIEANMKGRHIYHPNDYVEICETARKNPGAYKVKTMDYKDFKDFSEGRPYQSIRPGNKKGDPCVTDLRQIKYNSDGSLEFKINHKDNWTPFPQKKRVDPDSSFKRLYKTPLPITKRKFEDLQQLLPVIPEKTHKFYKKLKYK